MLRNFGHFIKFSSLFSMYSRHRPNLAYLYLFFIKAWFLSLIQRPSCFLSKHELEDPLSLDCARIHQGVRPTSPVRLCRTIKVYWHWNCKVLFVFYSFWLFVCIIFVVVLRLFTHLYIHFHRNCFCFLLRFVQRKKESNGKKVWTILLKYQNLCKKLLVRISSVPLPLLVVVMLFVMLVCCYYCRRHLTI